MTKASKDGAHKTPGAKSEPEPEKKPLPIDPKPLAAYRLGLLSRLVPMWQNCFDEKPEPEWGIADAVLRSVTELIESSTVLINLVSVSVYAELRPLLQEMHERWKEVKDKVWKRSNPKSASRSDLSALLKPPAGYRPELATLADLALENSPLNSWVIFGAAIGRY